GKGKGKGKMKVEVVVAFRLSCFYMGSVLFGLRLHSRPCIITSFLTCIIARHNCLPFGMSFSIKRPGQKTLGMKNEGVAEWSKALLILQFKIILVVYCKVVVGSNPSPF